ncbi:MAG: hypothetical protein JW795_05840 [Chitinivibrionales bacterium]|nr:hypothetical protein [Chitinivibrionales bacterium]
MEKYTIRRADRQSIAVTLERNNACKADAFDRHDRMGNTAVEPAQRTEFFYYLLLRKFIFYSI